MIQKKIVYPLCKNEENIEVEQMINSCNKVADDDKLSNNQFYKTQIVWKNVVRMAALHMLALYGLFFQLGHVKLPTVLFTIVLMFLTGMGVQAGNI